MINAIEKTDDDTAVEADKDFEMVTANTMEACIGLMKYWNSVKECLKAKQPVSANHIKNDIMLCICHAVCMLVFYSKKADLSKVKNLFCRTSRRQLQMEEHQRMTSRQLSMIQL
jgi:hypothetical protein